MLFPDVSVEEWVKRHPSIAGLEKELDECPECGGQICFVVPWVSNEYVGFAARKCDCGNDCPGYIFVPRTVDSKRKMAELYSSTDL